MIMNYDEIIKELNNSKLGVIPITRDNIFLETLLNGNILVENVSMFYDNNSKEKNISIYKVDYPSSSTNNISSNVVMARHRAVLSIFKNWTLIGHNKRNCKDPYKSKTFMQEIKEMYNCSDTIYVVVAMPVCDICGSE